MKPSIGIPRIVLAGALLALTAALGYAGLRAGRYDLSAKGILIYFGIPGLLWLFYAAALWRFPPRIQQRIALATVSGALCLLAAEISIPILEARVQVSVESEFQEGFDVRGKRQVIADLRAQGTPAYPALYPRIFFSSGLKVGNDTLRPLSGVANAATVLCVRDNEDGRYVVYPSDPFGFRNPSDLYAHDGWDIALVGDSFTQGICLECGSTIGDLLRAAYPRTANLGFGGNGPLTALATLREYAEPFKPGVVFWLYYEGNDLFNLSDEMETAFRNYLEPSYRQNLRDRQREIDQALRAYADAALPRDEQTQPIHGERMDQPAPRSASLFKFTHLRRRLGLSSGKPAELDRFGRVLTVARDRVASWEGRLVFVYLPERRRFADPFYPDTSRKHVLRIVKELGIPVLDVSTVFGDTGDPEALFPFRKGMHYNRQGARLIADTLLKTYPKIQDGLSPEF